METERAWPQFCDNQVGGGGVTYGGRQCLFFLNYRQLLLPLGTKFTFESVTTVTTIWKQAKNR